MRFDFPSGHFIERDQDPGKAAVVSQGGSLSWRGLEAAVEHFCGVLEQLGVPSGHPVLVFGHKELDFVVAFLGCIRSRRPYLPCDVSSPSGRLAKIAALTGSRVLVDCTGQLKPTESHPAVVCSGVSAVLEGWQPQFGRIEGWNEANPLVYLLFTSGSTGGPKGVPITRRAVMSFLDWISGDFGWTHRDIFFNQAALSFDLSMYEMLGTFHLGATVVLSSVAQTKDTRRLIEFVRLNGCTLWISTPSFAALMLADSRFEAKSLPALRQFVFCGERLPGSLASALMKRFPGVGVVNTYGPTEATVATTRVEITPGMLERYTALPVGFAKRGSLLEIDAEEAGPRTTGEILILGDHVSEGYFGQPELNSGKFFVRKDGVRELPGFRSGDLGYFEDGMLFVTGRMDHQLKLHGYRIDPVEIDEAILCVNEIAEAMTVALLRNEKVIRLVSFCSPKSHEDAVGAASERLLAEVRKELSAALPSYMMPSEIRVLESLPHNTNHKIDRKALLELAAAGV